MQIAPFSFNYSTHTIIVDLVGVSVFSRIDCFTMVIPTHRHSVYSASDADVSLFIIYCIMSTEAL